ncbi:MAG: DUF1643 domain-containing protein [Verrucomicrobia bacterium]|nr:DUF1643 domain-containing protein [Verrucomicrobiota bacterium]
MAENVGLQIKRRGVPLNHVRENCMGDGLAQACNFSVDRRYRYALRHTWEPLLRPKFCTWVGLNPSIADEHQLDPTLRRIRAFSAAWGYNGFIVTNLFALVSTDPNRLYTAPDPVGRENDFFISKAAQESTEIIAAWGALGGFQNRCQVVLAILADSTVMCLKETKEGYPSHPLYVAGSTTPKRYRGVPKDLTEQMKPATNKLDNGF